MKKVIIALFAILSIFIFTNSTEAFSKENEAKQAEFYMSVKEIKPGVWEISIHKKFLGRLNKKQNPPDYRYTDSPLKVYIRGNSTPIMQLSFENGKLVPVAMTAVKNFSSLLRKSK